jgi:hypothetical protein
MIMRDDSGKGRSKAQKDGRAITPSLGEAASNPGKEAII